MKKNKLFPGALVFLCIAGLQNLFGQPPSATPAPKATPALPAAQTGEISRERRAESYAKLFEAQRYMLGTGRSRSQAATANALKLAKQSLQKALELNPNLAEAYTLLAEISLSTQTPDIEEAILLATIATKLNADSFGARRILARVYTIKSQLPTTTLEPASTQKAIAEWKEVARLDPRNAEAWAFLSEFYDRLDKNDDRIAALKKWMAAASPLETRFYRSVLGTTEDLSPESAGLKLGGALVKANRFDEAVEILSQRVADDPDNALAIDLLRQAMESSEGETNAKTLEFLQQALYANPSNQVLVELLSDVQVRLGKTDDAITTLKKTIQSVDSADKATRANLQVTLGDVYSQSNRNDDAIKVYEQALVTFGIEKTLLTLDDQREFATKVFEKMIKTYKNAGKPNEARAVIERARLLLGKADLFADKQLISFLRETGRKQEALQAIRTVRKQFAEDYSLLRTEATILTELGRVDEGVALVKGLILNKTEVQSAYYDDFTNYLFISGLYTQAKRGKEAIDTAQQAFTSAQNDERRQLASLSLATAQHLSGNYLEAEQILRAILKKTPGNPMALNNLGYFLLQRNSNLDEAVSLIEKAVRIDPNNSSYLDSLGWGYFKLGKLAEAERYLKAAARLNISSPTIHEHLGDLYQKLGNDQSARSAWQKALTLSTDTEGTTRIKAKIAEKPGR